MERLVGIRSTYITRVEYCGLVVCTPTLDVRIRARVCEDFAYYIKKSQPLTKLTRVCYICRILLHYLHCLAYELPTVFTSNSPLGKRCPYIATLAKRGHRFRNKHIRDPCTGCLPQNIHFLWEGHQPEACVIHLCTGSNTGHTETQAESTVRVVEKRRGEYCSSILHVCLFL